MGMQLSSEGFAMHAKQFVRRRTGAPFAELPQAKREALVQAAVQAGKQACATSEYEADVQKAVEDAVQAALDGAKPEPPRKSEAPEAVGKGPTLEALDLPAETKQFLAQAGLLTLEDVQAHPDLTQIRGIGAATAQKIRKAVEAIRGDA